MELKVGDFGLAACQDVSDQKKKYVSYSRILQGFTLLPPVASQRVEGQGVLPGLRRGSLRAPSWGEGAIPAPAAGKARGLGALWLLHE